MRTLEKTDRCPDCQAGIGEAHQGGCDVARCLWDGGQRLMCSWYGLDPILTEHDCGDDSWTGYWPGEVEMAVIPVWTKWVEGRGWAASDPDDPQAAPDLNKLRVYYLWDRVARSWVLR